MVTENKKIKDTLCKIPVIFEEIGEVVNDDERFIKVKIWLMHLGKNQNGSVFEKDVVDEALPSLAYIPIVGFIKENKLTGDKDFLGHKYVIVKDDKGVRQKYIGSAYGVILSNEDNNAHYEDRVCDDGETREFLVVDGVMWKMFEDSTEIMEENSVKSQSMELLNTPDAIEGYEDDNGDFHFTKFTFRAACILGEDVDPAMMNSTVEVQFTLGDMVNDIVSELNNEMFSKITSYQKIQNTQQGGVGTMAKDEPMKTDFSQTVMEMFSDIANIVADQETIENYWHDKVSRYSLYDIQGEEAIVMDRKEHWNYYGIPFTMDGDKPVLDFTKAVRKKIEFTDYVEGETVIPEGAFNFADEIEGFEKVCMEKVAEAEAAKDTVITEMTEIISTKETEYSTVKAELDEIMPKYEAYEKAEQERIEQETEAKKTAILDQYSTVLADNDEYKVLVDDHTNISAEDLEGKCAIMYSRQTLFTKSEGATQTSAVTLPNDDGDDDGVVATKYGKIRKR